MMNLSITSSVVPTQWKIASIRPIAKVQHPTTPSDYRPISITPVLSRMLERIVVHDYIYPSLQFPPPGSPSQTSSPSNPLAPLPVHSSNSSILFQPSLNQTHMLSYLHWISQKPSTLSVTVQYWRSFQSYPSLISYIIGLSLSFAVTRTAQSSKTRLLGSKT
jgi:hypothetical protein